jgi:hypothetical protein
MDIDHPCSPDINVDRTTPMNQSTCGECVRGFHTYACAESTDAPLRTVLLDRNDGIKLEECMTPSRSHSDDLVKPALVIQGNTDVKSDTRMPCLLRARRVRTHLQ